MLVYTEAGQEIMIRTLAQDDITTGRMPVYMIMWNDFLDSPLWGHGTFTTLDVIYLYHGHNIYLQILREHGLIGFLIFTTLLLVNFFGSVKMLTNTKINNEKILLSFSIGLQLLFILWGITGNSLYDVYPFLMYVVAIAFYWKLNTRMRGNNEKN